MLGGMDQRFTLVTLGVRDLARSTAFFETLGWRRSVRAAAGAAFFQCGAVALSLYPRGELAKDAGVPVKGEGFGGFSIGYNGRTKAEVDAVMAAAQAAGATIVTPAHDVFWGGYSGYFRDLDGHLWEIAWNPHFPLDDKGGVTLPD